MKSLQKTGKSARELEMMADSDAKGFKAMAHELGFTVTELKNYVDASKSLAAYSEVTGQSAEQFTKAFGEDAAGSLSLFINKLGEIKDNGGEVITVLEDMDISEIRLRDTVLRASGAGDLLTESIDRSNKAWEENTALVTEANRRYETTESQLTISKKQDNGCSDHHRTKAAAGHCRSC